MIDDCVQLTNDATVLRAYIQQPAQGVVLARRGKARWVVWKVFRPHKAILWNCFEARYFNNQREAEAMFVELMDEYLPEVSCDECGFMFSDQLEGCDECLSKKYVPSTNLDGVLERGLT